jgi:hypothetical protein
MMPIEFRHEIDRTTHYEEPLLATVQCGVHVSTNR